MKKLIKLLKKSIILSTLALFLTNTTIFRLFFPTDTISICAAPDIDPDDEHSPLDPFPYV